MKSSFLKYAALSAVAVTSAAYVVTIPTEAATPFKDIPSNSSHLEAIDALYNQKIITGRTATTFEPSAKATRAETALFMANAMGLDQVNVKDPGFVDVPKSSPYYGAIAALANAGIIKGYDVNGKKEYRPNNLVKRAHIAKFIALGFELDQASSATTNFTDVNAIGDVETRKYIKTLVNYNITQGTSPTTFAPYNDVSRAQLATFLYRSLKVLDDEELIIIGVQ